MNTARIPHLAGGAVIVIGLGALAGWRWDVAWLTGLVPGRATMNPATALAFVLLGVALLLSPARAGPGGWAAHACAALVAVTGLVRLSGYVLRFDPGIDDLLFAERLMTTALPSRMAPHTALGFVLMGAAVLLQRRTTRRARLAVQALALASSVGALVSVIGHAYGTRLLSGTMALNTALAFLVAATGVLWSQPDRGLAAWVASRTVGGLLVRRLVPAMIVITLLLGWLRLMGERAGLYDTAGGTALSAASMIVVFVALAWWSARSLDRTDAERRTAERALRDSEHRLFQILEAMPVAVFVVDAAGRPYYANQASRDILGTGIVPDTTAERLPEVYQAFVAGTPDPYPPERQPIVRAMHGARAYVADIEIHRPDRRVPLEVWAAPVYDKAGTVAFAVAAFSDITKHQRAEQALRESEERHRLLFERNPLPAWVFDLETLRFLAVNDAAVRTYGYTRDEFLTLTIADIRPPEDVPALRETVARVAAGHAGGGTWRHRKKDGSLIEVEITSHVLTFAGRPSELVLARDITARRRAEEALRASEEQFRTLATTATDAIVSADQRGNVTYFNPGAEKIFGYTAEELSGKPLTLLMPERFRDTHRAGLARYLATGEAHVVGTTVELAGRRKDGTEFPLELSLASWRGGAEIAFTGIMRDITERKRAEETLRRYAVQLEVANAELDTFAYSVSHDLRAPLRSIDGFSQALREDCADQLDAVGRDHLERVRAATQRMGALIDDLLRLARVTRGELRREPVDLSALVRDVVADLRRSTPAREVELTVAAGVAAEGDPRLLRVVLENLLGNAWKYTARQPRAAIEFGVTNHDGERAFFVRDNGVGFDMRYAGKLFGAFQRLHSSAEFEGSGVGLATVQRIVRRHGGRVWAEGAPGDGATFYFTL